MGRGVIWALVALAVLGGGGLLVWLTMASSAQFRVDGDRLHLSGRLSLASTERLDTILEENGDLAVLVLGEIEADGGATSILQKGRLIRAAGLSTEIAPGTTLSGDAAYLFLAGVTRRIRPGAALAVTGWDTPEGPAADLPHDHPAHTERLDYVERMLGAPDFYRFALEAGRGGPHVLTPAELAALEVVRLD
jgi:hypothetical protein